MEQIFANIIVDATTLNKSFIFKVSDELKGKIKRGDKVVFPFGRGNNDKEGFVLELLTLDELKEKRFYKEDRYFKSKDAIDNLKSIKGLAKGKIAASDILLKIAIFICKEYAAPISLCVNAVLPVKKEIKKNTRQRDVIDNYVVADHAIDNDYNAILNDEQREIADNIISEHKKNEFDEHLIYGVTGSGKTEVYIKVVEEVLREGKKAIIMIPEIALTHQTVIRLKQKFDKNIAIIHSRMSKGEKYIQYKKCEDNEVDILVGPRSALFAPFENLGVVVIDEVDDMAYKSDTTPRYDTLTVARYRCSEEKATLITLSATPSIKIYHEAKESGRIHLHRLSKRASGDMPKAILVDMREEYKNGNKTIFSKTLIDKIKERLDNKEQIMLYMNRRGYDTIFTCKNCGETYKCPHCDVALVSHNDGKMKCHYCGYEIKEPLACPNCHSTDIEKYGMGTEKLEEQCMDLFPDAKILRMDRDTTLRKDSHDKIVEKFRKGEADILIGTQMIIKGHDFPRVTLVAIMRADLTLYVEDYKSSEATFSMITQCVGRSGRKIAGESIIQAYDVDSDTLKLAAKQDFDAFYNMELASRKRLYYPPFSTILSITLASELKNVLDKESIGIKKLIDTKNKVDAIVLGPTSANPEKVKDAYFKKIIIKCKNKIEAKQFRKLVINYIEYVDKKNLIKAIFDIE